MNTDTAGKWPSLTQLGNAFVDGLLGLATGDAFGVPFEFLSRAQVRAIDPTEMVGKEDNLPFQSRWGGRIPRGAWSDDTSMTVAAMQSIIDHHGKVDYTDIMEQFRQWWYQRKYTALDFPFGLGGNINSAMNRYLVGIPALECGGTGFMDNGNGALMRMFPFSMLCIFSDCTDAETMQRIHRAARITHGHEISTMSCCVYTFFLQECLRHGDPRLALQKSVLDRLAAYENTFTPDTVYAHKSLFRLASGESFDPEEIPETGYVVDSLVTAVYSLVKTGSYEDAIRMAVSFGYDTDTNAAITGSVAGATYGIEQIPTRWLQVLKKKDELIQIGEQFVKVVFEEKGAMRCSNLSDNT